MIMFDIRKKWEEIAERLNETEQVEFLADTFSLYRKSFENRLHIIMGMGIFVFVMILFKSTLTSWILGIIIVITVFVMLFDYIKSLKRFEDKWSKY